MPRAHGRRRFVLGAVLALVTLGAAAVPASAQDPAPPSWRAVGQPTVGARFAGTKGPSSSSRSATPRAIGDVTIQSLGCSPSSVAHGAQTTCSFQARNTTTTATTVDLSATGDAELAVTGATLGASTSGGTATAEDAPLPPASSSPIQVNAGATFAGYYPLQTPGLAIPPTPIQDDQMFNITTQPFRWSGGVYVGLGVSANGYIVVGGADTAKDATATPQDVPNAGRPDNVLAPFWTDLTPAGGGALRLATVAPTGEGFSPCNRPYFIVVQWEMFEYGTDTMRKAQLWIQADDPECATDTAPAETIYFTYDHSTMTTPPARPFRIAAENSTGTVGGMRPVGELPSGNFRVTSSGATQPGSPVTWDVVATGTAGGTGTIAATVASSLIPGSSTVSQDVTVTGQPAPTVTDDPDDETVTAGQQAVFTAAATGAGSVAWQVSTDDGATWDPVPGASATTLAVTASGDHDGHQYRAVFSNPTGTATATTDPATLTVERIGTTTTVVPSPSAPSVGQAVTFTAEVFPAGATGTVQFSVDGTPLGGPVAVSGGSATSPPTSSLAPGDHTVTAVYSGDGDHAGSTGTGGVSVGKTLTTTTVALAPTAPLVGEGVTFTATVAPPGATGTVQFTLDGVALGGPVAVAGGTATSPVASGLERGAHVVVAAYSGDATRAMSTSGPVAFTVARRTTTTGVVVAPAAPQRGDEVTFTATVTPGPTGGAVQFSVDGNPVGAPVGVVGGTATSAPVSDLPAGDHTVSASYSGGDAHCPPPRPR
ncbi:MAG TPA: Ig-like domain-containing protein [Acidimicrobiales bacterium]|nr:Ig-like domain-containing protein [Acidimicrobiales bacterium]